MIRRLARGSLVLLLLGACGPDEEGAQGRKKSTPEDQATTSFQFYSPPSYMMRSTDYSVSVDGKPVEVISDAAGYDYVHFSMRGGPASVEVTALGLPSISGHSLSPMQAGMTGTVADNKLTYSIDSSRYTVVSIDGKSQKLLVAADPEDVAPPSSGTGIYNVMSYGADPKGKTSATSAIQDAIDAASAWPEGRGTVYVPPGKYKVGNLSLKSDMNLYLAGGSALWFSGGASSYTIDWDDKGKGTRWIKTEEGAHGIKIYGRGTLDGNALSASSTLNNNVLVLKNGYDFEVEGIILRNASRAAAIVAKSNDVSFDHVKVFQNFSGSENGAVDLIESQDVTITSSIAASLDDSFSVKTYSYTQGSLSPASYLHFDGDHEESKDITIDSVIAWTGAHAFNISAGTGQDHDNITFKNSVVYDAAHAISMTHDSGAGVAKNITWDNIDVERITSSNLGRSWAFLNINANGGYATNLNIHNIKVRSAGDNASPVNGHSASNKISNIFFTNIDIDGNYATSTTAANLSPNAYVSNLKVGLGYDALLFQSDYANRAGGSDWSRGNDKADCGPGWAVTGMSQGDAASGRQAPGPHALRCKNYGVPFNGDQSGAILDIGFATSHQRASHTSEDWDPGYAKVECGLNEYVSGVSQHPVGRWLEHLRCAAAPMTEEGAAGCETQSVGRADPADRADYADREDVGNATGDWDQGYAKAECADDKVAVGVSVASSGMPRKILCCNK